MCDFFSFVTKGSNQYYFDWEQRKKLLKNNPNELIHDSHTSICHYYSLNDDKVNKYEYNPIKKKFNVNQINIKDDRALAKKWVEELDFKTVVEPLIIKPIVNPFSLPIVKMPTRQQIKLLRQWASVRVSVRVSVWSSISNSIGNSIGAFIWISIRSFINNFFKTSINDSISNSVNDVLWAYISSYFKLEKWIGIEHEPWQNPYQSAIDLWEQGLIPSYDGKVWRLHSGKNIDIIWEKKI